MKVILRALTVASFCSVVTSLRAGVAAQPGCLPPAPLPSLVIPYVGLTSGCSNAPSGNPVCITGETIQFKIGDGIRATDCPITYVWQFENGPVNGTATINHQFSTPGTYTVLLTIYDVPGNSNLSATVTVADPTAIPVTSEIALTFLFVALGIVGTIRIARVL